METDIFKQVGSNIQTALLSRGRTQQFLADKLGVSKQVMSKIISGSKAINVAEITKIANILDVSTDYLLTQKTEREPLHYFAFLGQVEDEKTREKIDLLRTVIDEMLMLEEYTDA